MLSFNLHMPFIFPFSALFLTHTHYINTHSLSFSPNVDNKMRYITLLSRKTTTTIEELAIVLVFFLCISYCIMNKHQ